MPTATQLLDHYERGALDPREVIAATLDALAAPGIASRVVLALGDERDAIHSAEESARRWESGMPRPLEGVPFGIKDVIATEGFPTTGGARVLGDLVPRVDAVCVARLRAAGAIPVAKLATSEFAAGQPDNATFGRVPNPWDPERWSGGSSTGSGAAVAARLLPLAIGTDTGGSVRIPSAWCGTTGLKPTYGVVPRTGVVTLSWTLDHVGPMARTARDCALMLAVMAGHDVSDPTSNVPAVDWRRLGAGGPTVLHGVRIGAVRGWFTDVCDHEVLGAWTNALDELADAGATIVDVELPSAHLAFTAGWQLLFAEAASMHEDRLERVDELDPGFVARAMQGRSVLAVDYFRAQWLRALVRDEALAVLDDVDVLCTIGVPGTAPRFSDLLVDIDNDAVPMQDVHSRATMFGNFTGLPALMMPSGRDRKGMPTAIQLVGAPYDEATIIDIADVWQARTGHHLEAPPSRSTTAW